MIQIKVKAKGLTEFIRANEKTIDALDKGTFVKRLAEKSKNRAVYRAPRKTGTLIKAIRYKMNGPFAFTLECSAKNERGDEYPEILEFGLSRFIPIGTPESPREIKSSSGKTAYLPFMRWAIWRTLQEADKIFKETILKYYK